MRHQTPFILLSYALLTIIPFQTLLADRSVVEPLCLIVSTAVLWFCVWAVFGRPALFHWLLLPAFLLLPADLYLYAVYGNGVSAFHLGMLTESSWQEAIEFAGRKIWLALAATCLAAGWWRAVWHATQKTKALNWTGRTRKAALVLVTLLAAACIVRPPWMERPLEYVDAGATRPFGWLAEAAIFVQEKQALSRFASVTQGFTFGARRGQGDTKPLTIVLVIGESSRYDRFGINGYARDTTPLLKQEKNLVVFSDAVAAASATRLSLPVMLTRKGAINTFRPGFAEKSFISAFREAGFRTYWLSNQIPFGEYDTPTAVFARESDTVSFLNAGSYSGRSGYDGKLLLPLAHALQDAAPAKLVILHTLGNHWNYSLRHPPDFDRWQPSLSGIRLPGHDDASLKKRIGNSYDNSILYTDWFLAHVISQLKAAGGESAMVFMADHGENLQDGGCDYSLHGHNTVYDFHVPLFAWYSPAYAAAHPQKVRQMKRHKNAPLATENIFHTVTDMGGLDYAGQTKDKSPLSATFRPQKRYVDSYGWADYDHAAVEGTCHEIIDKGTPLPRSADPM